MSSPRGQGAAATSLLTSSRESQAATSTVLWGHAALMPCGRGDRWWPGATLEAADLTVQPSVRPLGSKDSFGHPSVQQTLPHSFLPSAGSSPGAPPWPNPGWALPFRPDAGMVTGAPSPDLRTDTQQGIMSRRLDFSQTDLTPRLACYTEAM